MKIGRYKLTSKCFYGKTQIEGSLDLQGLTTIPEGFNPTVGGSLYLRGLTSIPKGFSPTVGGSLDLQGLTSVPEGFSPTVEGSLYLRGLTSIPEGFNPTVGGSLDLEGLTSIPEGFSPTVGGSLNLGGPTTDSLTINRNELEKLLIWQNGRFRVIDGIFCEVISEKRNVMKVKIRGEVKYVVTDGENYSHGDSIKEAKVDLIYKISNRDTSVFVNLTLDSVVTKNEAIKMYRVITGACKAGTKHFVNGLFDAPKSCTVAELIEITHEQYGNNELSDFFNPKGEVK